VTTGNASSENSRGPLPPGGLPSRTGVFVNNGDYWTIGLGKVTFPVNDVKGLNYIHRLLQHPGKEFHALDILNSVNGAASVDTATVGHEDSLPIGITIRGGLTGDSGEMIDAQAKRDYQRRLRELNELLEDQRERGNHEEADRIESEVEFLTREIERAFGLGGRVRRAGSNAERARLNVTRAIGTAIEKVFEQQTELGEVLRRSIKTGSFCSYIPEQENPIIWRFATDKPTVPHESSETKWSFSHRDTSFLHAFISGTAFVGRDAERLTLTRVLDESQRGEGRFVLIEGSAGVGKTRLAAEVANEAMRRGMLTFVGGCYDRDEPVPFIPFVEILESALAESRDPAAFREVLGSDAPEIARLVPQLRRSFPDIPAPIELPPEQSRHILFNAVTELVKRISNDTPSFFLLDDLQWADEGTLLLLRHLIPLISTLPVMVIGTLRDFEPDRSGHLNRTLDELIRHRLIQRISLNGLSKTSVGDMLRALSGREPPDAVVRPFFSDTEGNPFFVEELYRHLTEQGQLTDSTGAFHDDLKLNIEVPRNVRVVIRRRLALMKEATLKTLYTAAVIGRSFTFELLAAATSTDLDALLFCVEEAENFGLISSSIQYPEVQFRFSHELSRRAVLSQLSAARRQRLHLQIGIAIENLNAGALDDVAIELAHHYQHAGAAADSAKTIQYLSVAARRARLQGALTEAGDFYRNALILLKRLPDTRERDQLELNLQLGVGAVLMATLGYADGETAGAYQRASDISERLGDSTQLIFALTGLATQPLLRGELDVAQAIADKALAASQRHGKSKTEVLGYHIAGVVQCHAGRFGAAWDLLSHAHGQYREEEHVRNPQDPGILVLEYMALTAWQLGLADTAQRRMQDAVNLSDRLRKPFGVARCSFYAGYLQALLRNPLAAQEFSEKAIKWSTQYSIQLYLDASRIVYGWAIAKQGRGAEGVACTRAALESFKAAGNRLGIGAFMGFFAEALLSAGLPDEASAAIDEGFRLVLEEQMDISYLWWIKGKLVLKDSIPQTDTLLSNLDKSNVTAAENCFRTALSIATNIGAKSYAIRSAASLGRLLAASGRTTEARVMIEPLLTGMTEGFDTLELVDARKLLEDLR